MARLTRHISWLKAARRDFEEFPQGARDAALDALTVVAGGGMPGIAKPLKGFGSGVLELALRHRGEAYRVVYAVQILQLPTSFVRGASSSRSCRTARPRARWHLGGSGRCRWPATRMPGSIARSPDAGSPTSG